MKNAVYFNGVLVVRIPFFKNSAGRGRVGIEMGGNRLSISHIKGGELRHCYYDFVDDPEARQASIKRFVSEYKLKGVPCTLVLNPRCYQLLLTDRPDVEEEEVAEALPWQVKDLLHYPLEEVVLQHIPLPDDAFNRRNKMLYVAAAPKALLNQMADVIEQSELVLDSIDIAELVVYRSVMENREINKNTAVLYLDNKQGFISIGQQHAMYLSRNIDLGLETLLPALKMATDGEDSLQTELPHNSFLLDTQRSLDFFDSQQGKGPVVEFLTLPMGKEGELLVQYLQSYLNSDVIEQDIDDLLATENPIDRGEQQHCLLSALAAIRWQSHAHSGFLRGGG